ncbi:MAG: TraB/GumN family protein [Burkholderiales bacterium]|nr:TraB/GumN family protein [Burkholderiales bacterium]
MHRLRLWFVLVAVLLSLPCAGQGSTPLLYEVTSETTTLYLFGTIHVGTRELYPLSAPVEAAFAASGALALEADPTDQTANAAALAGSVYRPPDNLERHISPDLYRNLLAKLPQIGLPVEYARALKPHLLAMTITVGEVLRLGYEPALGLDHHFAQRARREGKPIVELESMLEQMQMLESLSDAVKEDMLHAALASLGTQELREELDALAAAWKGGDADGIARALARGMEGMDEASARELEARVYVERNEAMAQKLEAMLGGRTVHFVAVGAGHLTGTAGLPALLEAMGFRVRQR